MNRTVFPGSCSAVLSPTNTRFEDSLEIGSASLDTAMSTTYKPNNNLEVDETAEPVECDDGYGSSPGSDTTSLSSSIRQHVKENGRTYHHYQEGKYLSPNDEAERDRLDFYHAVQLEMLEKRLFLAPLENAPHRVLDCGTGTGIWALDMADLFPSAIVTGVDLSAIQPEWVFPNVKFEIDDLDQEWTFPENHFDFIHTRQMITGIRDYNRFLQQMFKHTAPGGWFELVEGGFQLHSDDDTLKGSKVAHMFDSFLDCAAKAGIKLPEAEEIVQAATKAGYVDVQIVKIKQPWGAWPRDKRLKHVGRMVAAVTDPECFESYALALLTRVGGVSEEEGKKICREASREVQTTTHVHAYNWLWHVYGRKPETETNTGDA
ncbi:S-adenosyl-L-methionine-dependent methyltransferase [Ascodesmis nigricans]|uniref:S-adenosyl-L-methionine-dependent methyltransferase n=1 Tax=Ascodesmis nigricans TaxID=341454 RepID=A0A4S2N6B8_9PEZI|nr:S-adenosyl-L-methionine-dependent methyltransferase [Ascodesmis nigricans]